MIKKQEISLSVKGSVCLRWLALGLIIALWVSPVSAAQSAPTTGSQWLALGTGLDGPVYAIAISGDVVYVGGMFHQAGTCVTGCNNIAKWNRTTHTWSALDGGTNGAVYAIAVRGSDMFVGGTFDQAGNCTSGCNYIAKWNGLDWSSLGTGMNAVVRAIAANGSDVYVGGEFTDAGGCTIPQCHFLDRWSGTSWSALGSGVDSYVFALAVADDVVYVGGQFYSAGGVAHTSNLAKWDAGIWKPINASPLDTGIDGAVDAIAASGSTLYAGGSFSAAGSVSAMHIVQWNGSNWIALPSGAVDDGDVYTLAMQGSDLYVGGKFHYIDGNGAPNYIVKWNGSAWSPLGTGTDGRVSSIAIGGSHVFAGGGFNFAGGVSNTKYIADYFTPSSDANLSSLALSSGTLSPQFSSETMAYSAHVGASMTEFQVTPSASHPLAEIKVNGLVVASGSPSGNIPLLPGSNLVTILVTAEDDVTAKTYTLTVTRATIQVYLPVVKR